MPRRFWISGLIVGIVAIGITVVGLLAYLRFVPGNTPTHQIFLGRTVVHATYEPDLPADLRIDSTSLDSVARILEKRFEAANLKGQFSSREDRRIQVDISGDNVTVELVQRMLTQGLLEFVDAGDTPLTSHQTVLTTGITPENSCADSTSGSGAPLHPHQISAVQVYRTIMTNSCFQSSKIRADPSGRRPTATPIIDFTLNSKGTKVFAEYTTAHMGTYLAVVLDKQVISSPLIQEAFTSGIGAIQVSLNTDEASQLILYLNQGALPFPVKVIEVKTSQQ